MNNEKPKIRNMRGRSLIDSPRIIPLESATLANVCFACGSPNISKKDYDCKVRCFDCGFVFD